MNVTSESLACPLCGAPRSPEFFRDVRREASGTRHSRRYHRCSVCQLIFVPPHHFLSFAAEKAEYDLHQNSPEDMGYRRFLSRLFLPMQAQLQPRSKGLDFGCGPGPTLSVMFEEAGHHVRLFDPFYAPFPSVLEQQYDFITATEVVEHLRRPLKDLGRIWSCLKPGGLLGVMTKLALDKSAFSRWHYKDDLTHVCFFSKETFRWLADYWWADLEFVGKDVILLRKKGATDVGSGGAGE